MISDIRKTVLQEDFMENGYKGPENGDYQFTRPEDRRTDYGRPQNSGRNLNGFDMTPMTMGEWVITLIIMAIPCINIIMCFVWGFSSTGNLNRRNFCRAYLAIIAVAVVVYLLIGIVAGVSLATILNSSSGYNTTYYY